MGGLTLSFSATDHSGLDFSDLSIIGTDGRFKRCPLRRYASPGGRRPRAGAALARRR